MFRLILKLFGLVSVYLLIHLTLKETKKDAMTKDATKEDATKKNATHKRCNEERCLKDATHIF